MVCWDSKVHYSAGCLFFFFFFFFWLRLRLVVWPRLGDPFKSQNSREFCTGYSLGWILGCVYTTCSYGPIRIYYTIPSGSAFPPSCLVLYFFVLIIIIIIIIYIRSWGWYDFSPICSSMVLQIHNQQVLWGIVTSPTPSSLEFKCFSPLSRFVALTK